MEYIIRNTLTKSNLLVQKEFANALGYFLNDDHPLKGLAIESLKTLYSSKYETVKLAALNSILEN